MNPNDEKDDNEVEKNQKPLRYPRSIAFIIGNEFCERFSYYGAKAILVLYFTNVLSYSEDMATEYYHVFAMACYFTPVLGAIIADSLLGKFRTIFYISILYCIGNIILSYASYLGDNAVTWVGLTAIALGTGGIKPCVSAFGGDQFGPGQEQQLQKFFSLFYISINAGSLLSTFITPILREDVHCFNRTDCFPLAFGVPAALMIVALFLFILGKVITNYVIIPPKKENVVVQVVCCVSTSLKRKLFKRGPKREHWLDYADDKYDAQTISDIKAVMRILFLYLPLPIFWALFDQQGSRWTLQATKMDGNLFGVYRLKPDQIQVVNPLLIILFIPIFEYIIYPLLAKINLLKKPLQRMVTGGILAAIAFLICGFFQLSIEGELPTALNDNSVHLAFFNGMSANIQIKSEKLELNEKTIDNYDGFVEENVKIDELNGLKLNFDAKFDKNNGLNCLPTDIILKSNKTSVLFITKSICDSPPSIGEFAFKNILEKPGSGGANVALFFTLKDDLENKNFTFRFKNEKAEKDEDGTFVQKFGTGSEMFSIGYTKYKELDVHIGGNYKIFLLIDDKKIEIAKDLEFGQGGSYVTVLEQMNDTEYNYKTKEMVKPNSIPMLWQIVQYAVITGGEIMFSITGLEFSYSQAPNTMKAVLQAAWLLTVAFGNVIVIIIAAARISKQSTEFFFFGGLMIADMIVFAIMAYFYVPYKPSAAIDEDNQKKKPQINGSKQELNGIESKNGISNNGLNEELDTKF